MTPFDYCVEKLDAAFVAMAAAVPQPQKVNFGDGFRYRYVERSDQQAIVLKVARLISCLRAAELLLKRGYLQELAMLQRVLDETDADISFLAGPYIGGAREDRHDQFLEYFWAEEFEDGVPPIESRGTRGMVSRDKILAYNARTLPGGDPSTNKKASSVLHKAYSGFIHGAAPHLMDMYGRDPPRFHTAGLANTSRQAESARDFLNYPYRALMVACVAAIALRLETVQADLYQASKWIGKVTGLGE
jgi:hypothetical protein